MSPNQNCSYIASVRIRRKLDHLGLMGACLEDFEDLLEEEELSWTAVSQMLAHWNADEEYGVIYWLANTAWAAHRLARERHENLCRAINTILEYSE
jgi:hypothetical protein